MKLPRKWCRAIGLWLFVLAGACSFGACVARTVKLFARSGEEISSLSLSRAQQNINDYPCKTPTHKELNHLLQTGDWVSARDIHDHYSTVGCSIEGTVKLDQQVLKFEFDYGGMFAFDDGRILVCGTRCCPGAYEYCSWDEEQ